jgi:hypothetical protein
MKAMVYARKVNIRVELLQWILSAARSINNAAVLRKITSFLATRVRKCIEADGGHFRQLSIEWRICNCTFNNSSTNAQYFSFLSDLFTVL